VGLAIRQVSLPQDRPEMIDILSRNFGSVQERRFDWRHSLNPAGESWSWFMYDRSTRATVAMATLFPRHMRVRGKKTRGGQVGEFAVDSNYRSLGPAVQLQKATFEPVNMGELLFCYDCPPHDQGMSTFARIGMHANCEVHRYALPLRSDEYLSKRLGHGAWTKPVVRAANLILRTRGGNKSATDLEICEHMGPFDDEFSHLDEVASLPGTVRASRNATDLNWRYLEDPMASLFLPSGTPGKYRMLEARRAGELKAFLSFLIQPDGIAVLVDLFGLDLGETGLALIDVASQVCRREQVSSFHGFCSEDSELKPLLTKMGFHRRERNARIVAYAKQADRTFVEPGAQIRWTFSQVEVML
jgi:hypothetical protein